MPQCEFTALPILNTDESEEITTAVKSEDFENGDENNPQEHPIAIALRRQPGIDDARVFKREVPWPSML